MGGLGEGFVFGVMGGWKLTGGVGGSIFRELLLCSCLALVVLEDVS